MKGSNAELAARVMLGELEIDDVPEARQQSVSWFVRRYGPDKPLEPVDLLVHLMRQLDAARGGKQWP